MPFKPGNKYAFQPRSGRPLDKQTVGFHPYEGQTKAVKQIEGWQQKLRDYIDQLVKEAEQSQRE